MTELKKLKEHLERIRMMPAPVKLKTLNDLNFGDWIKEDIKEEALKWVKEFRSKDKIYFDITSTWFQKFFNITEDDLQ